MIFLMSFTPDEATPPTPEMMAELARFGEEGARSGTLIATGGMFPSSMGSRVRLSSGKYSVTDGPFPEAKEVMGGWAVLNVSSKEEAIEQARRFMAIAGEGETEIRQLTNYQTAQEYANQQGA